MASQGVYAQTTPGLWGHMATLSSDIHLFPGYFLPRRALEMAMRPYYGLRGTPTRFSQSTPSPCHPSR